MLGQLACVNDDSLITTTPLRSAKKKKKKQLVNALIMANINATLTQTMQPPHELRIVSKNGLNLCFLEEHNI